MGVPLETMAGYELVEQLSANGDVDTWRARDIRGVDVVLKRFPLRDIVGFTSRTSALLRLTSPHAAPLRNRGKTRDRLYAARDYFSAGSLRRIAPLLDVTTKLRVCADIARALEHAHRHGLVHGAVKPENILFGDDRKAMLVDFSLAGAREGDFTPPELPTDPRSDQWALAAVAGFLLVGHVASQGETLSSNVALDAALRRALAHSPAERFRGIDELASALESAAGHVTDTGKDVRVERKDNALRVQVEGKWTAGVIEACTREIDHAMSRFPGVRAIGYVLNAVGGNHSHAIDALGALHHRHRARLERVAFVSNSPQARGACILIGTRGGLAWKTFASAETMDAWLRGGAG